LKKSNQITGNVGLYSVCFELSKRGWNVLPTSRNAKGPDVIIYNEKATKTHTIQVKALSNPNPVGTGKPTSLLTDFFIICRNVYDIPEFFIASTNIIRPRIKEHTNKKGEKSYWLERKDYEEFKDKWNKIGFGFDQPN